MTLHSVLGKVKSGTEVAIFDYLSNECYANIEVEKILNNNVYLQKYKNAKVYGIDAGVPCFCTVALEIRVLLNNE